MGNLIEKARQINDEICNIVERELDRFRLLFNNKANVGKTFIYRHFFLKDTPIWHKDYCNIRLHVYYENDQKTSVRIEFGFLQRENFITEEQKDCLRKIMLAYARLHGYSVRNDEFYKINYVITEDTESIVNAVSIQLVKLIIQMNHLVQLVRIDGPMRVSD
ncbi:hypothetical protein [Paenibacillus sp. WC2504]|uniref:hypothetical protein n=1 Tax=Paenibacillus sp. WC2504 TaxID=3461403 RepID=UPI004045E871